MARGWSAKSSRAADHCVVEKFSQPPVFSFIVIENGLALSSGRSHLSVFHLLEALGTMPDLF